MKNLLPFFFFIALSASAVAQTPAAPDTVPGRFFAGFAMSNTAYNMKFNPGSPTGGRYAPIATVHVGYWLSERASVQLGFGYGVGRSKSEYISVAEDDRFIYNSTKHHTRAFSAQLTGKYIFTNPARRLQLYGLASLTPVWGGTRSETSSTEGGVKTTVYQSRDSGLNVFASVGLGANYRISKRFEAYMEVPLFSANLSGNPTQRNIVIGTGLNYRFK